MGTTIFLVVLAITACAESTSVTKIWPNKGSLNGGTRLTIDGSGFSANQFNFGAGNEHLGNVVKLVSSKQVYDCEIHKDGTHEKQIMCYTPSMPDQDYTVKVIVDGTEISTGNICSSSSCKFKPQSGYTPTVTGIEPRSGPAGSILKLSGKTFTSRYGSNQEESTNGRTEQILRVFVTGQNCELRNGPEKTDFYGIQLDNNGADTTGYIKCKINGSYVGNQNATFMLSGELGRALPDKTLYKISSNSQLYMFQAYAEIDSISPSSGSVEGGTELTISGKNFDQTRSNAKIDVGGADCVVNSVSNNEIKCTVGKPSSPPQAFTGNRGLLFETWNETSKTQSQLSQVGSLLSNASDYRQSFIDEAYFMESSWNNTVSRMSGFFVVPFSGSYSFHIMADDGAELYMSTDGNPNNKALVASCSLTSTYNKSPSQSTSRMLLSAGQTVYMEVYHREGTGGSSASVSARYYNSSITNVMTGNAIQEVQVIEVRSDVTRELQTISISGFSDKTPTYEVQEVTVENNGQTDGSFRLGMYGVYTAPIAFQQDVSEIGAMIAGLPIFDARTEFVGVTEQTTSTQGIKYKITFSTERGDLPDLQYQVVSGTYLTVDVSTKTNGKPSGKYTVLTMAGVPAPILSRDASVAEVQTALEGLFGTRCPDFLGNPAGKSVFYNYEDTKKVPGYNKWQRVTDVEAFCGRACLKNPTLLYMVASDEDKGLSMTQSSTLCFAYKGGIGENVQATYTYRDTNSGTVQKTSTFRNAITTSSSDDWQYSCVDLLTLAKAAVPTGTNFFLRYVKIFRSGDMYVDEMFIGRSATTTATENIKKVRRTPAKPNGALIESVTVKDNNGKFDVTLVPFDCGYNFPKFSSPSGQVPSGGSVSVTRVTSASPPIQGKFSVNFQGETVSNLNIDITAEALKDALQTIENIGSLSVERDGDCANFDFIVTYLTLPGDPPLMQVDGSLLTGNSVTMTSKSQTDGHLLFDPLPGEMTRTLHDKPQVIAKINDVPTKCTGDCTFEWTTDSTPTVTGVSPSTGNPGTSITISGTKFHTVMENNTVIIGGVACPVTASTSTSITCTIGNGPEGIYKIEVNVHEKGLAQHPSGVQNYIYSSSVTTISPSSGSLGGGISLTVTGIGFRLSATVEVGGTACVATSQTHLQIICTVPARSSAGAVDVVVKQSGVQDMTSPTQFTYDNSKTATVTSVSPGTSGVTGGSTVTISGSGFGGSGSLRIGGKDVNTTSFTDSEVTAELPPLSPGTHNVEVISGSNGAAVLSNGNVPTITYTLRVTNVYPLKGSLHGGTRVTITGSGFDNQVEVKMGTHRCDVKSVQANQIVCVIDDTATVHNVDNQGVHWAFGIGYGWNPENLKIKVGDKVRWSWTYPTWLNGMTPRVEQTTNSSSDQPATGGFSSGAGVKTGSFEYKFTKTGASYYWSGYVDAYMTTWFRGSIQVESASSFVGEVSVKLGGFEAEHVIGGSSNPSPSGSCPGTNSKRSGCTDPEPSGGNPNKFTFGFWSCYTPKLQAISERNGTTSTAITLSGEGFSTTKCQNEISFGDATCSVESASASSITCKIDPSTSPSVGIQQSIAYRVNNQGNALIEIDSQAERTYALFPLVSSISPSRGSRGGHTKVTITGSGFTGSVKDVDVAVTISGYSCTVERFTYTEIVCASPSSTKYGIKALEVKVKLNGNMVPATCDTTCEFGYEPPRTPTVSGATPNSINGQITTLRINGSNFGNTAGDVTVTISTETCSPTTVKQNEIQCTISNIPVGNHDLVVNVNPEGKAIYESSTVQVSGVAAISGVNPSQGSTNGGTEITISGNGFMTGANVTIDGTACPVKSVSLSTIVCTSAAHAAGSVDLVVTSNAVSFTTQSFTYSSGATPSVTSLSKSSGSSGDTLVVSGTNFGSSNSENTVTIGNSVCTVTSSSSTSITCTVGSLRAGTYNVKVGVSGKGFSNEDVTFAFAMTATSITPNTGSTAGGQTVVIGGAGFDNDTVVTICGNTCTPKNPPTVNQYTCITPPGPSTSNQACSVVVTVNTATQTLSYNYDASLTPEVTGVSPARGGTGGGTTVTITGSGFGNVKANGAVTIGGSACVISTLADTQIVCVTESRTPSVQTKVAVEISGNGIASQTSADFQYIDVWSSVYTWGGVGLPGDGELIVIPKGMTVLLDTNTAVLKMLLIQGGSVIFDEKDVELQADNILITNGGLLQIGTEAQPFQHNAIITLHGNHRTKELPIYGTKALSVREGTIDLHGKPVPVTWTKLAATAQKGSTTIVLKDEVTWSVGDEIALAATGGRHSQSENEEAKISAIANDRKTITLESPLKATHIGVSETIGGRLLEFRGEVGLLTRNILVRGTNHKEWIEKIEACPDGFDTGEFATQTCFQGRFGEEMGSAQFGGQMMIHAPEPNKQLSTGRIEYVEFNYVGQAFRLGRYPVHFHLNGDMSHSYVRGCGIHETFNRAINVHGTHNLLIEKNVVFNTMGGSLFLEDGIETGNVFQYNVVIFARESSSLLNDDVTPASFWVTNPNNTYRHNAAAGGSHFGYWYRMHDHPEGPSRTDTVCPKLIPTGEFFDNSAHSFGWFGLWIFPDHYPRENGQCGSTVPFPAVFNGLFAWNCEKGIEAVNAGSLQFVNFTLVNNQKAGYEGKLIIEGDQYSDSGPLVADSLIAGYGKSFPSEGCTNGGMVLPYGNGLKIKNIQFVNFDADCSALIWTRIDGTCTDKCGGFVYQTSQLTFMDSPNHGKYAWLFEGIIHDIDGTLCGSAGCKVVPSTGILPPTCVSLPSFNRGIAASKCPSSVKIHRFAFKDPYPESLDFKDVKFTNQYGSTILSYAEKRISHKPGWMAGLVGGEEYQMEFVGAPPMTNLSYSGTYYQFDQNDWIIMRQKVLKAPDRFKSDSRGYTNSSDTSLDGPSGYHGDWEFDNANMEIRFLISGNKQTPSGRRKKRGSPTPKENTNDLSMTFESVRCFYTDCIPPPDPNTIPPIDKQPDDFVYWSNSSAWPQRNNTLPENGDDIVIDKDTWMVTDIPMPWLNVVTIYGVLEFDNKPDNVTGEYKTLTLNATHIIILGGRLVIGFEKEPFLGTATILLRGSWATPAYTELTNAPTVGAKVIAVFGGLDLHGKDVAVSWTKLQNTANAGDSTITLAQNVSWQVNDEIVIAPTGYDAWETETFRITAISSSQTSSVLTLNGSLAYRHIAHTETINGTTFTMAAEVGLLTRNVKVIGEDYDKIFMQSFGARILVGTGMKGPDVYLGYARVSNTEFFHAGQEGYTDFYDARFALTYLDVGSVTNIKPSYVKKCAFHNNFSPAIGVYGTNGLSIEDNVFHHTVWWGVETSSVDTALRRNVFVLMVWEGSYQNRVENGNYRFSGAVNALKSTDLVLEDNNVAGTERTGYRVPPVECGAVSKYARNSVHTALYGISIFPTDTLSQSCATYNSFTIWKCRDAGINLNNVMQVQLHDNILIENNVGIHIHIIGPSALGHQYQDKQALVQNTLVVGATSSFDCTADAWKSDENIVLSSQARSWKSDGSHIGICFVSFTEGSNNSPEKPHFGVMSYPAIMGLMKIEDVAFANFNSLCGKNDFAITVNGKSDDGQHPMKTRGISLINVNKDNLYFNSRPNVGKINSADCVDMDCDGLKKALVKDEDGSLLGGTKGAIISQSEWQWGGDPRRGLSDARIPKEMLTRLDGSRISVNDIAPNKGIIRNSNCVLHSSWQAYECHDLDYEMLIIESMDSDTETRRLSPVALLGNGYLDLINGPQDQGWCSGYTCRKRISTFYSIVATGVDYEMYFTSVSPQHMRYLLLNSDDTQSITLALWYSQPNRRDVYHDGVLVMPKNGRMENGNYILDPPKTADQFKPNVSEPSGTNYFDRETKQVYVVIRGNKPVEVKTIDTIVMSFQFPPMTVDDFYGENMVQYLAAFFDLPPSKVRIVDVVRQTSPSGRRKKRSVSNDHIIVEVGDPPVNNINDTAPSALTKLKLDNVTATLYNEVQLGNISNVLNASVVSVGVAPVLAEPGSPEFEASADSTGYEIIIEADKMRFNPAPVPQHEGVPFKTQPKIQVLDKQGQPITKLGTTEHPWQITANLTSGSNPLAELKGNTTVTFVDGWANFTDLLITQLGDNFVINFTVTSPKEGENFTIAADPMTITGRPIKASVSTIPATIILGNYVPVGVTLIDEVTQQTIEDISWRGHTWKLTAEIGMPDLFNGTMEGTNETAFDTSTSQANLYSLKFPALGVYVLKLSIKTEPSGYDFYEEVMIKVRSQTQVSMTIEQMQPVTLKFDADYDTVVGTQETYFGAMMGNYLQTLYPDTIIDSITTTRGSIYVSFTVSGSTSGLNNTLQSVCSSIQSGQSFTFNSVSVTLSSYMTVGGTTYYGVNCAYSDSTDDDKLPAVTIVAIVLSIVAMISVLCAVLYWKFKVLPKTKTNAPLSNSNAWDLNSTKYIGKTEDIQDILFREKSFMSINGMTGAPAATTMTSRYHDRKSPLV